MKKILGAIAVAVLVGVFTSSADINVVWSGTGGFLANNDSDPILIPFPGQSALVQLIFTPNNWVEDATPGAGLLGSEQLLSERWIATDQWGTTPGEQYQGAFQVGYIYARIFAGVDDSGGPSAGDIGFNHWYYAGPLTATIDNLTPANPDYYDMNRNASSGGFGDPLDLQVIPEPTSMVLAALGGLVLLIRRRFAR